MKQRGQKIFSKTHIDLSIMLGAAFTYGALAIEIKYFTEFKALQLSPNFVGVY